MNKVKEFFTHELPRTDSPFTISFVVVFFFLNPIIVLIYGKYTEPTTLMYYILMTSLNLWATALFVMVLRFLKFLKK
jgi:hypothetical protein